MSDLPLSKYLDPADYDHLQAELVIVDRHFLSAREQHPQRRWEYAMALRAFTTWGQEPPAFVADVGGAGSPFTEMCIDAHPLCAGVEVIDPNEPRSMALATHLSQRGRIFPAVFCLSVLEHVEDLDQFLYHLSCLTAPGGLLFLTMDACDAPTQGREWPHDIYHFHWMRRRIFSSARYENLGGVPAGEEERSPDLTRHQFSLLGSADWQYHGAQVYNYSFASLALIKRS